MLKQTKWVVCVALLAAMVMAGWMAGAAESCCPKKTAVDKKACGTEEWIPLFNGKDLTGWQNARNANARNRWYVEDGLLTNKDKANNIGTMANFKDFCLKLDYKIVPHGNSGTYLRGRVEVQILDSHGKEKLETGDDGGIYGIYPPALNASNPAGEWNTMEAMYAGDTLTVKLNGKIVQDKVKIDKVTGGALPGDVNDEGPIMLQGDHGKIWFRNIMIRPCSDDHAAKADGSDTKK
ncbi:MAG: DUF1080 domain-containing protein [Nitrospiraceae bacterium]|nr:DUF1080 domain-containing protein [Nitrospiraceae bacterium]